ncbi:MAG: hypothetical protein PVJ67_02415 [Candidatus Pacearchaeota archaeon]|jgi:hypothetical protein
MDFLHHKVTDEEREEIRKKSKEILDDFSEKLEKVDREISDSLIEREDCERKEGEKCDESFSREVMFLNAPKKTSDFIIAERKKW